MYHLDDDGWMSKRYALAMRILTGRAEVDHLSENDLLILGFSTLEPRPMRKVLDDKCIEIVAEGLAKL